MRNLTFIFLLLSIVAQAQENGKKPINSRIDAVTVFTAGAEVHHVASARIAPGETDLVLSGVTQYLDQNSIQVNGKGDFLLMGVSYQINYLRKTVFDKKLDSLVALSAKTADEISLSQMRREVLNEELALLNQNRNLGGTDGVTVAELKSALQFYQVEISRIKKSLLEENSKTQQLNQKLTDLNNQINTLRGQGNRPTGDILLRVRAQKSTDINLEISYFTQSAGWAPAYDIRVDKIDQPIKLAYRAHVWQNTGENWDKVDLTFSNASPNQGGTAPSLAVWYLMNPRYNDTARKSYGTGAVHRAMASEPAAMAPEVEVFDAAPMQLLEAAVVEGQTAFRFVVPVKYTVGSGQGQTTVDLTTYEIPAKFEYYSVPKLDPDAFLMARVFDWTKYSLLPGEMQLYFEGGFVGRSYLDPTVVQDTLSLSLGRDKGITIERKKVDQYSKTRTVASNRVESRGYTLEVRNRKSVPIEIVILDQVPVSAASEVEVREVKTGGALYNQSTGELKWKFEIKPSETIKKEFQFEVKLPKGSPIRID